MNIEEAKKMEGTEFIYQFSDGDTIPAYVKKFDPEIGLTCFSLQTETVKGWKPSPGSKHLDSDGTFCVLAVDFDNHPLEKALMVLDEIQSTGVRVQTPKSQFGQFAGCAF